MEWDLKQYLSDLEQIVNIDSGTATVQGVRQVAEFFLDRFRSAGFHSSLLEWGEQAGPCLEARSSESEEIDILMVGHMDTVFLPGTAVERPFRREQGRLTGPGVADMKGGLVMMYTLATRLKETCPGLRVCVAMNCDEETGSAHSKEWLDRLAEKSRYAFVFEPGRGRGDFVIQRKGCMDVKARFHGVASHAGNAPEKGASAVREMASFILKLTSLQNLKIGTSINAGVAAGGTAPNVVADLAECFFDVRFERPEEMERIRQKAEALAASPMVKNVKTEIEISGASRPLLPTKESRLLTARMEEIAATLGQTIGWRVVGGVSDANHIAGKCPAVLCGCGPCGDDYHSTVEYVDEASIQRRLELLYQVFCGL